MVQDQRKVEYAGDLFVEKAVRAVQQKAWDVVERIATSLPVGVTERQAIEISRRWFAESGADKHWHKPIVRFGKNTVKAFSEPFDPDDKLAVDDVLVYLPLNAEQSLARALDDRLTRACR